MGFFSRLPRLRPIWLRARRIRHRVPAAEPAGSTPVAGDGLVQPGEVVWAWVPYQEDPSRGKDRPVLVIAREGADVIGLPMTSKDHDRDREQEERAGRYWMDVGAGPWDSRQRPSEVRLDRVVRLAESQVRREGAVLDPAIFAEVLAASAKRSATES